MERDHKTSREVRRPFVEVSGSHAEFVLNNRWMNLYYLAGERPDWMDVGDTLSVYVIGPYGGVVRAPDYAYETGGDETFVAEVVSVERLHLCRLSRRHLMPGVKGADRPEAVLRALRRRGSSDADEYSVVEVVRLKCLSYDPKDLSGVSPLA